MSGGPASSFRSVVLSPSVNIEELEQPTPRTRGIDSSFGLSVDTGSAAARTPQGGRPRSGSLTGAGVGLGPGEGSPRVQPGTVAGTALSPQAQARAQAINNARAEAVARQQQLLQQYQPPPQHQQLQQQQYSQPPSQALVPSHGASNALSSPRSPRATRPLPARTYASEGLPMKTGLESREVRGMHRGREGSTRVSIPFHTPLSGIPQV